MDLIEESAALSDLMWRVYHHVRDGGADMSEGGASVAEATYLRDLATRHRAGLVFEIGFNLGFSAIAFLESGPDTRVVSFELDDRPSVLLAKQFVDERYPGRHELVLGDSLSTVTAFAADRPERADLIFVDGGHDYEVAAADLRNARAVTRPGGHVVIDDLVPWYPWGVGPTRAWTEAAGTGLLVVDESYVDGRRVERIEAPGDRAWSAGRFLA
ncbi:class I SAM-dependent methyltransferase [Actinokineospora sp. PR83]|uniref:class I SAM-dependent methyltransferase n=1 Tax=Actinokineospora sp. PR83 TaxID=2884908 RepID=UPI001F2DC58F|nr:class I SAM-dependent methyltransferase [Actinokineospora sp. PR83]MCG8918757.1 class I SAM-dependent methyltransferase [Actinokineospora sp. PR83]